MNFPITEVSGQLKQSSSIMLDANGNGAIYFTPNNSHQRWEISSVVVSTNQGPTNIPIPTAEIFINGVSFGTTIVTSTGQSLGATWSGNQDSFSGKADVGPCDSLAIVFTGGIAGTMAFSNIRGTYYTRR